MRKNVIYSEYFSDFQDCDVGWRDIDDESEDTDSDTHSDTDSEYKKGMYIRTLYPHSCDIVIMYVFILFLI